MDICYNKRNLLWGRKNAGFTLIESLIAVALIGLLAVIVLVAIGPARQKMNDAKRQSDLRQINLAMGMCFIDAGCVGLEEHLDSGDCGSLSCPNEITTIGEYLPLVPADPIDSGDHQYSWASGGTTKYYCVFTKLQVLDETWLCASRKGVFSLNNASEPTIDNCCEWMFH